MNKSSILYVFLLAATAACTTAPSYKAPELDLPANWTQAIEEKAPIPAPDNPQLIEKTITLDWWKEFNDPTLTRLIEEGLKTNSDLGQAAAAISAARAGLRLRNADLLPTIGGLATASRTGNTSDSGLSSPSNSFNVAALLSYEIDLWGKLRDASTSARATLLSTQNNRDAIRLAIASEIAGDYFNMCALESQLAVTQNTVKSRKDSYDYYKKQYENGSVDALTFRQAEAELASAQAQEPELQQGLLEQKTALSVLIGRSPKEITENKIAGGKTIASMPVPPSVPKVLPSALIQRRPDIAAAEQNLIAANADIGVARAEYFPTLSIAGLIGLDSGNADNLLRGSARNWQVGGALAMPLVNAGRTGAVVDAAKATKESLVIDYQDSITDAFKEVIDSMSAEKTSYQRIQAQNKQTDARTEALRIAGLRYKSGYSSYLEVLDSERSLHQAQLDLITAKRDRLIAVINLYKALGGGWDADNK
jgi:multidrug efflux system outer membrane protein